MSETRWVLVAEDDDDIRRLIRDSLQAEADGLSVQIVEAKDGAEAITKSKDREYHCVVTDLRMPRSTGVELIKAMQASPLNANTPKVVVTGVQTDEFAELASQVRIIAKPFEPEELARTVIREIKLGRIDERVAVHLMNPFLEGASGFLEKGAGLAAHTHQPALNKSGEGLVGDVHCNLALMAGVGKFRFTFSYDLSLLEYLKVQYFQPRTTQWATLTPDSIARQTSQLIFDEAIKPLQAIMGTTPRLSGSSIFTYKNESEYGELVRTNGISVVVKTDHGRVIASAFAKPKPKRF